MKSTAIVLTQLSTNSCYDVNYAPLCFVVYFAVVMLAIYFTHAHIRHNYIEPDDIHSTWASLSLIYVTQTVVIPQIAKFMGPTWGPPGSCRPQMGPMSAHEPCHQGHYDDRYRPSAIRISICPWLTLLRQEQLLIHINIQNFLPAFSELYKHISNTMWFFV